jgi:hypothetical protein
MSKYVLLYHGGKHPENDEEKDRVMAAWGAWMESAGDSLIDIGNPLGPPRSLGGDGDASVSGYSLIEADSEDEVVALLASHPMAGQDGARIDIHEAFNM